MNSLSSIHSSRRKLWRLVGLLAATAGLALMVRPALAYTPADESFSLAWSSFETDKSEVLAWGDVDGDGDLDLAVGNFEQPNRLYLNSGALDGTPQWSLAWSSAESDRTYSLAWGDADGDGDLDLAVGNYWQPSRVYRNDSVGDAISLTLAWTAAITDDSTYSVAWADADGDGQLDLAVGNYWEANRVYRNVSAGNVISLSLAWSGSAADYTTELAWGDVDGDGDLDLAAANDGPNSLYRNAGGTLGSSSAWSPAENDFSTSLAWADCDGDGDLDLAVGNKQQPNRVYRNDSAAGSSSAPITLTLAWSAAVTDSTTNLAWGDADADGDLDLVVGNQDHPSRLYLNDMPGGTLSAEAAWSSFETDSTKHVAWGDADGDGDLDLVTANYNQPNRLYDNELGTLNATASYSTPAASTRGLAWGDADGDGDLDLAVGNSQQANQMYRNEGGVLMGSPAWSAPAVYSSTSVAWGDADGDGDLDLAVGNGECAARDVCYPNQVYRNDSVGGTSISLTLAWSAVFTDDDTYSLAWGDYDGDGDLDLATGGYHRPNRLYRNTSEGTSIALSLAWSSFEADNTTSLAWGDVDGDGDLDLAVGNQLQPNRLYRNDNGVLTASAAWSSFEADNTQALAWGDVDGDGDLDLAVGNAWHPNRVYKNDGGVLGARAAWSSLEADRTTSLVWGDGDGDGDLDLAAGNLGQPNRLYRNDNGTLTAGAAWSSAEADHTQALAWGDADGDGDLDLAAGNGDNQPNRLYRNGRDGKDLPGSLPLVHVERPGPQADFYSDPAIHTGLVIPINYSLAHPQAAPVEFIRAWYSPDGGGHWRPAVAASSTLTRDLGTSSAGVSYTYYWDVAASGVFGRLDNVVFRLEAVPAITHTHDAAPGPYLYGAYAAQSLPFRVRGTQVRVMNEGGTPAAGALVYRLPAGQPLGGAPIADRAGTPFCTDAQGYLQGGGEIDPGDRLLALAPAASLAPTGAISLTETYTLYHTSGQPSAVGVEGHAVGTLGVQTLTVSAAHPLILFDLVVSVEWDAHNDPAYLEQLAFNLQRASEYLYDFTDGQVALGDVHVFQSAEGWLQSNVVINANNRLRPFAIQGGIVPTETIDPDHNTVEDTVRYGPGQVTIGSTWNRYGNPGLSLGDDWSIILAHELSHYLLFHDDTYLGLDEQGYLIPISTCVGSAMGDLYNNPANTEFIADEGYWQANCAETLPERTLGRNEWETIRLWYPDLVAPASTNAGPASMPFDVTRVHLYEPLTPTDTLLDPTFYIDYVGGGGASSEARAYLLRDAQGAYVFNLGSPFGGQNRVIARGAVAGDRLCVFDRPRAQFGCEEIELGDDRLAMRHDASWDPVIQVRPVNSATLELRLANAAPVTYPLRARLYPDIGWASEPITLTYVPSVGGSAGEYTTTIAMTFPVMSGNIQVWVEEPASEAMPRRETVVAYGVGGNPGAFRGAFGAFRGAFGAFRGAFGAFRGAFGAFRGAFGAFRGAFGAFRGAFAPIVSPDGQMIFFTENQDDFAPGTLFAVQAMAGLPSLPPGRVPVGQGYNLLASPGVTLPAGSISLQYLANDVLVASADETDLALYYWDGQAWTMLDTTLNTYFNLATAPSRGEGVYSLMASTKLALHGPGWNMFAYPVHVSQPVSEALLSISGHYTAVYGYEPVEAQPWRVYAPRVPTYVVSLHELEYGKGYWINVSASITLHLASGAGTNRKHLHLTPQVQVSQIANPQYDTPFPPATFYGAIDPKGLPRPLGSGLTVTAWIGERLCGQGETIALGSQVVYVVHVWAEDTGRGAGCGAPGRTVSFQVETQPMTPTARWGNSQLWEVPLSPLISQWGIYLPVVLRQ